VGKKFYAQIKCEAKNNGDMEVMGGLHCGAVDG